MTDPDFEGDLGLTVDGPVATLWLNRPAKRNAVTQEMWGGIADQVHSVPEDVRVLVLRGVGDHFCAGADIDGLGEVSMADYHAINQRADDALAGFHGPTLAYITGSCVGGGAQLALACDLRIADDTARFGITPARLGILYPAFAVERAVRVMGPSATKHLLYTAEIVDAERALRVGLIDELLPSDEAPARLEELTATLVARSLLTQVGSKAMVDACVEGESIPADLTGSWLDELDAGPDFPEGRAAFAEKRAPRFSWRPGTH